MEAKQIGSASELIDALGGTGAVANGLQVKRSTVSMWRARNSIPGKWLRDVMSMAEESELPLTAGELLSISSRGKPCPDTEKSPMAVNATEG